MELAHPLHHPGLLLRHKEHPDVHGQPGVPAAWSWGQLCRTLQMLGVLGEGDGAGLRPAAGTSETVSTPVIPSGLTSRRPGQETLPQTSLCCKGVPTGMRPGHQGQSSPLVQGGSLPWQSFLHTSTSLTSTLERETKSLCHRKGNEGVCI